ncbi:EAL domain-containing protein [Deefgea tanakiae]|uniref:EAL domain-containing protein n=1 Tax=Deefgea tanakiae TaxID=2865840 RepID=A0ABX8Z3M1_9NEIS|nr:EAL domain-containing protein [Deefgea tanakiae]QZA77156.1 EAL domain-containing protein [Deefgea tanakiae]
MSLFSFSPRTRFIAAFSVLQVILLAVLVFNTQRIWSEMVQQENEQHVQSLSRLLKSSFIPSMVAGNRVKAADLLDSLQAADGIEYLVLIDANQRVIAARGWDVSKPMPVIESGMSIAPISGRLIHARLGLDSGGEALGEIRFGVLTDVLSSGFERLLWQSGLILLLGFLLLASLLTYAAVWISKHLERMIQATEASATGFFEPITVPAGADQIAKISQRFNDMALSIKAHVQALTQSETKYQAIADASTSVELLLSPEGKLLWVNAAVTRLTAYSVNECMLLPDFPLTIATPEERLRVEETLHAAIEQQSTAQDYEFRAMRRDGSLFWAAASWQPMFDVNHSYQGLRLSIRDNSEIKDERLALRKSVIELRQIQSLGKSYLQHAESERARMLALLAAMRFGVLFVDNENRIVFFNPAFCEMWGLSSQQIMIGRPIGQVLQLADNRPAMGDVLSYYLEELASLEERVDFGEVTLNDSRVVLQSCYRVTDPQGETNGRMWVYEDVTQQRLIAERMVSLAERDALTGLFNRHRFQQELHRMVSEADRRQTTMALVFFDLDEFKLVNDSFGHTVGDELLKSIAREVGKQVRLHEVFARLGGDEFAVLLPECDEFEVSKLADRIVQTVLQMQFVAGNHPMRPSTSVGVAMYPLHASSPDQLVAHADTAMYQAKAAGKGTWRIYRPESDHTRSELSRLSWKERIIDALEHDGFELHYQGIYHTEDKSLAHLEALVRMKDADSPGGIIMPGQFIPHAEKTGKIVDLDRWVIREVIQLLAQYPDCPSIAVNVSGRSFDEPELPLFIAGLLAHYKVNPKRLLVELTETSAVSDLSDAQRFIDALRDTGCVVCLDDFGVGFASFAYLKQLKADVLKIDGLFIRDLPNDRDSQIFVRGMVSIAHDMGKTTIAEFVESETIFNMLLEFGVDQVQGYWLDKPQKNHPGLR